MADYATLTQERDIACTPGRLFHVMTDRELRQKWSAPDDYSVVIINHDECLPGGREKTRFGPKQAPVLNTTSLFYIVTSEFLSFPEKLVSRS
ncbi:MAG: hypothetical protein ACK5NN_08745 [Sphingomonadaceae bacterium]